MATLGKPSPHSCKTWDRLDSHALASLLKLCQTASEGTLVHALITQSPLHADRYLANLLIDMYGQCGSLDDALATFASIPSRNVFSWNLIIRTCALNGHALHALSLFDQMVREHDAPDRITFLAALSACTHLKDLHEARTLESFIVKSNMTMDVVIQSAIINMYHKCGSLMDAERIFNSMQERDVVCWNTMIAAYSQLGQSKKARVLFENMVIKGINPSQATYITLFSLCANEGFLSEGRHLHACLKSSCLVLDVTLGNALVSMYGKCNSVEEAYDVFHSMRVRDFITWSTMMSACVNSGCGKQAIQLFHQMHMEGLIADTTIITNGLCACACVSDILAGKWLHACLPPSALTSDVIVLTALVNMYGKCQCIGYAQTLFDELADKDVVAHNAMIAAYNWCGLKRKGVQHFKQMHLESILPGRTTYVCVLDVCNRTEGLFMHAQFLSTGFNLDNEVCTQLISMYGRLGNLRQLELILGDVRERDVIVWNAMISVSVQLKQYDNALHYFSQLQVEGLIPTAATFASSLSACVTQAALTGGKRMHTVIIGALLNSDPIVATALVNMYAKCGNLELSQIVFDALSHQSNVTWNALVAAYAQHGCSQKALDLFKVMLSKGIRIDHATFSSVLSACSRSGYVDEGVQCFTSVLESCGIKPSVQHYNCLIDLISRVGRLEEGESIMSLMPATPISTSRMALLSACRTHLDLERSKRIADLTPTSELKSDSISLLLTNIFALGNGHVTFDECCIGFSHKPSFIPVNG